MMKHFMSVGQKPKALVCMERVKVIEKEVKEMSEWLNNIKDLGVYSEGFWGFGVLGFWI